MECSSSNRICACAGRLKHASYVWESEDMLPPVWPREVMQEEHRRKERLTTFPAEIPDGDTITGWLVNVFRAPPDNALSGYTLTLSGPGYRHVISAPRGRAYEREVKVISPPSGARTSAGPL